MGLFRKNKAAKELLDIFVSMGSFVHVLAKVEELAPSHAAELIAALMVLAPKEPIEPAWGDGRSAAFSGLMLGLANTGKRELVPVLLEYSASGDLNSDVIRAMATLGAEACIETCTAALTHTNEYVRSAVTNGVVRCAEGGWGDQRFLKAMFDRFAAVISGPKALEVESLAEALLALHPERGAELLKSPALLNADNRHLHEIVKALNKATIEVPSPVVTELLKTVRPRSGDYPFSYAYGQLLDALTRSDPARARPYLEEALGNAEERIRSDAIDGLLRLNGLHPLYRNYSKDEYARWPAESQVVADLAGLILQVESNGISAIFVNYAPLAWKEFLPQLESVGASRCIAAILECARMLGQDDPALDAADSLSRPGWNDAAEKAAPRLEEQWNQDRLPVLVCRYMLAHPENLRRIADDRQP